MQAVILTGIVAGFVHVVSGADHLIAMVPAAISNPQKDCLLYKTDAADDLL